MKTFLVIPLLLFALLVQAQIYSVDWYKIAGGGGISTNGQFVLTGTIGQPVASKAMTNGQYAVTGGFWSLVNVVQTPGAPMLNLSYSGNTVTVYWQNVAGWNLIQCGNIATPIASWSASSTPKLAGGTNYLNFTNPAGDLFFRLKQ